MTVSETYGCKFVYFCDSECKTFGNYLNKTFHLRKINDEFFPLIPSMNQIFIIDSIYFKYIFLFISLSI